uniref:Tc1-like transposase DDE domain-containing protein n=1 Tax=Lepeophtheirus salmonis TaxID=72036 RepID=A0A0K2VAB5_LEPSM
MKKTFTVDPVFNKQNNRVVRFEDTSEDLHHVSKMSGWVPHSAGRRRTLARLLEDQGIPVIPQDHQEVGQGVLRLSPGWGTPPPHTKLMLCKPGWQRTPEFWPKNFWPSHSPELNPLDYSIWWQVESKGFRSRHSNVTHLKSSVEKEWKLRRRDYIARVCSTFCGRLKAVIESNEGQIHK